MGTLKITSSKMFSLKFNLLQNITKQCASRNLHNSIAVCGSLKPPEKLTTLMGISTDRTQEIPVETSIKYLNSKAYNQTYGTDPVWVPYRRNHKGSIPPRKTRKTCIRGGHISTGNPCPICRDEYLVLHETNVALLNQFICPHTGSILSYKKTGLCQKTHEKLMIAIARARDQGLLTFDINELKMMEEATFVIVGGGIAGVTCAETLAFYTPSEPIILVSESALVKTVINLKAITQTLTDFNIQETHMDTLMQKYPNVKVIHDSLVKVDPKTNTIVTNNMISIKYKYLCLCMGAKPKLIPQAANNPFVIGIRDTDSVENFIQKLSASKEIVIVGNGGIASELVYKIEGSKVHWVIKDKHITATFIDPGAAEFIKDRLTSRNKQESDGQPSQRMRYEIDPMTKKSGAALGPDWYKNLHIKGALDVPETVIVHYECEIGNVTINDDQTKNNVIVLLSNGNQIHCDFIVSATGVESNSDFQITESLALSSDNGILVNEFMQSSIENIYAAGDLCTANWEHAHQWFPMKLWTQARQMGCYAAKAMAAKFSNEVVYQDFCFELFTHTTRLFGYKVVLLGLYNGQKLGRDYEILFRMTPGVEYIKFVMQNGRLQGCVLIGDTDLEETCENLILNQIDLSNYKEDLLNPDIDIEDYFD